MNIERWFCDRGEEGKKYREKFTIFALAILRKYNKNVIKNFI